MGDRAVWRSWLVALFGLWFVVDSFIYASARMGSTIFWNFLLVGALILLGSAWVALQHPEAQVWRSWFVAVFCGWMAVSPWELHFWSYSTETWITLVVGLLGVVSNLWAVLTPAHATPVPSRPTRTAS